MSNLVNSRTGYHDSHEAIKTQRNDDSNALNHQVALFYPSELGFVEQIKTMIDEGCVICRNNEGEKVEEFAVTAEIDETPDGHLFIEITQDITDDYDDDDIYVNWGMTGEHIGDLFENVVERKDDLLVNLGLINIIKNINTEKNG